MKKGLLRAVASLAVGTLIVTGFSTDSVMAATSPVFTAAGVALATGNGRSIQDIRADVARNAAMQSTIANHDKITKSDTDTAMVVARAAPAMPIPKPLMVKRPRSNVS